VAAIRIRFRAQLRSRWRAWLILALAAGAAGGLVVAMAAGAHRTQSAYGRYLLSVNAADAYVDPPFFLGEQHFDLQRVARLPQVAATERTFHLAVISRSRSGKPIYPLGPDSVEYVVPADGHRVERIDRFKLLRGRVPNPARPEEAYADTHSLRTLGVQLGEPFAIRIVSRHMVTTNAQAIRLSPDPRTVPYGRLVTIRVVGVSANARSDVDGGQIQLTPAFYRAYGGPQLGAWLSELETKLKRGAADLPAFRAAVHRVAGNRGYGFFEPSEGRPKLQRSMDLQAQALRLLAVAGGVGLLLLLGQALYRDAAASLTDQDTLRALGMTRAQMLAIGAARSGLLALPAAALSVGMAFLLSPLTPIGRARELEPHPGFHFDAAVLVVGAAVVLVAVFGLGLIATARVVWARRRRTESAGAPAAARVASAAARAGLPPSAVAGIRMALVRRSRSAGVPVLATLAAATLAVAVTVVALTFAGSLNHLLTTPALYGQSWDFETEAGDALKGPVLRQLRSDPAIAGVATGAVSPVEIGSHEVAAYGFDDVAGAVPPVLLAGRAPRGQDETALGTKTMDQFHLHLGDAVRVHSGASGTRLRIVGTVVLPTTKFNKLGEGALFSFAVLHRIQPGTPASTVEIRLAPGADRSAVLARLGRIFDGTTAVRPTEVGDFGGVEAMPFLVAMVFGAAAAAALAHALLVSIRRRRRDLAVLKTLGFVRRQVLLTVGWHATTVAAIGLIAGVPLGIAVGRFGWNVFAQDLGVVPESITPALLTLLVVPGAVLLANLIAALPALTAARTQPSLVLHAE
jgi:hypothetical protein